jgi:hypothetical protein
LNNAFDEENLALPDNAGTRLLQALHDLARTVGAEIGILTEYRRTSMLSRLFKRIDVEQSQSDDNWSVPLADLAQRFGSLHPEERNSAQVEYLRMVLQARIARESVRDLSRDMVAGRYHLASRHRDRRSSPSCTSGPWLRFRETGSNRPHLPGPSVTCRHRSSQKIAH